MNIRQVIKALNAGAYKIVPVSGCGCTFDWHIEDGKLVDGSDGADCYEGFLLVLTENGDIVAEHMRYRPLVIHQWQIGIPDEIQEKMQPPPTTVQRWETGNPAVHDTRRREALIAFLMEGGYGLARSNERGVANEYTMIMRELPDGVVFMSVTREEAEAWADAFLYRGDQSTEAFVGFRLEVKN